MNYTKKLFHGTAIVFLITLIASIIGYFLRIFYAKTFTVEEFGIIYAVMAFFGVFSIFQDPGLGTALSVYISKLKILNENGKIKSLILNAFFLQFISSIIYGLTFFILSNFFATHYFHKPELSIYIKVYSIAIMLSPTLITLKSIFQGFQESLYYSLIDLFQTLSVFGFSLLFIHFGYGIISVFLAYIFVYVIAVLFYFIFVKKVFPEFLKVKSFYDKKLTKEMFYFSFVVAISGISGIIFGYTDIAVITYFRSVKEVALYNASYPTAKILWGLTGALTFILLPMTSELWGKKDFTRLKDGINMMYKYSLILVLPTCFIFVIYPEFILTLLFGQDYVGGAMALRILGIGTIFFTIFQINSTILTGIGKPKEIAKIMIFAMILNLIGCLLLVPKYGIVGATISTLLSFILLSLISYFKLKEIINFGLYFKEFVLITVNSLLLFLVSFLIKKYLHLNMWPLFIISIFLGAVVYLSGLFFFKIITLDEINILINRLK